MALSVTFFFKIGCLFVVLVSVCFPKKSNSAQLISFKFSMCDTLCRSCRPAWTSVTPSKLLTDNEQLISFTTATTTKTRDTILRKDARPCRSAFSFWLTNIGLFARAQHLVDLPGALLFCDVRSAWRIKMCVFAR